MARDVFISYSSHNRPVADAVCHHLEAAGVRCWIAPRDIPAGTSWAGWIIDAIRQSRVLLIVFSAQANASRQVMREVERAVHYGVSILPFRVEDVLPQGEMEYYLSAVHWLDAMSPPLERHIESLVVHVRGVLAAQEAASENAAEAIQPVGLGTPGRSAPTQRTNAAAAALARIWARLDRPRAAMVALLVLAPVAADFVLHLHIAPPWPDRLAVDLATGAANALVFALVWVVLASAGVRRLRALVIAAGVAAAVLLVAFLSLRAAFVWDTTDSHYQDVVGFVLNPNVRRLQQADPSITIREMFRGYEYDPTNVWEPWSLIVARVTLLVSWFGFSIALAAVASLLLRLVRVTTNQPSRAGTDAS